MDRERYRKIHKVRDRKILRGRAREKSNINFEIRKGSLKVMPCVLIDLCR